MFKNTCVDISSNELRSLNGNKGYTWSCVNCRGFGNDLDDLKSLIMKLQEEIQSMKSEYASTPKPEVSNFEDIIAEINERNKRKRNLIIYGIEEHSNGTDEDRTKLDKDKTTDLLQFLTPTMLEDANYDIKPIRLGISRNNRPRPIKVILKNDQMVNNVIQNAKKLKNNHNFGRVSVAFDRTPREYAHYMKLKSELQERQNAGEQNLKIKYINSIAKIVTLNQ